MSRDEKYCIQLTKVFKFSLSDTEVSLIKQLTVKNKMTPCFYNLLWIVI